MKKTNVGSRLALYPMPVTVVGTMDGDISNTYVSDDALDENGHIDYTKLNLVLFEMPTYSYLRMGPVIGKCMKMH